MTGLSIPAASPYPWPWDDSVPLSRLALVIIDMQTDFCG
jgi:hypothetical protein